MKSNVGYFEKLPYLIVTVMLFFGISKIGETSTIPEPIIYSSTAFSKLLRCSQDCKALACLNKYRPALIKEITRTQTPTVVRHIERCLDGIEFKSLDNYLTLWNVQACLILNEKKDRVEKKLFQFSGNMMIVLAVLITSVVYIVSNCVKQEILCPLEGELSSIDDTYIAEKKKEKDDQQQESTRDSCEVHLEPENKVRIQIKDQMFDLSSEVGQRDWRLFCEKNNNGAPKAQRGEVNDSQGNKGIENDKENATTTSIPVIPECKPLLARCDINIHDPRKPVPSVLDFPRVDDKGRPLRRVFIPGRGWVSSKVLQQEREALFSMLTLVPEKQLDY